MGRVGLITNQGTYPTHHQTPHLGTHGREGGQGKLQWYGRFG